MGASSMAAPQRKKEDRAVQPQLGGSHDTPASAGSYVLELVNCGSPYCRKCAPGSPAAHGPYWYLYRWENGTHVKRYVGKTLPESTVPDVAGRTGAPQTTHVTRRPHAPTPRIPQPR